jgi:hypothetical protein
MKVSFFGKGPEKYYNDVILMKAFVGSGQKSEINCLFSGLSNTFFLPLLLLCVKSVAFVIYSPMKTDMSEL